MELFDWRKSGKLINKNGKIGLIKEKLTIFFFKKTFNKEGSLYLACKEKHTFFHFLNNLKILFVVISESLLCSPLYFGQYIFKNLARNRMDKL